MRFLTLTLCALALSICLSFAFNVTSSFARDDNDPKFTNSAASEYIGKRYVDGCMKRYMAMYRTDNLPIEQQEGFKQHANTACECMLVQARLRFTPREMADIPRMCCANPNDFITPDNDEAAAMDLHVRYIEFFMYSDASRSCGLVLHDHPDKRLYKNAEEFERGMQRGRSAQDYGKALREYHEKNR
jgi:hypothetical protein